MFVDMKLSTVFALVFMWLECGINRYKAKALLPNSSSATKIHCYSQSISINMTSIYSGTATSNIGWSRHTPPLQSIVRRFSPSLAFIVGTLIEGSKKTQTHTHTQSFPIYCAINIDDCVLIGNLLYVCTR